MLVMVIVGTAPNAAGRQRVDAEKPHENLGQLGPIENRVMLLVVINHEEAQNEQTCENAANNPSRHVKIPNGARKRNGEKEGRREYMPPTP